MSNSSSSPAASPGLLRELGPLMATAVVVGTVIGSGIFKKPQQVAENVPYFGVTALVWIAGGLLALVGALAYAEVTTLYPRAGGNYVFLREGYGRFAGFLWGWVEFFIIRSGSIAALATIFTESLRAVLEVTSPQAAAHLGFWPQRFITVGVILALAFINVRGVRWGGTLQLLITFVKVGSLLFLVLLPFVAAWLVSTGEAFQPRQADIVRLQPAWPDQIDLDLFASFGVALVGVLWAYHGWMNIAPVAEEVKNPQRNLPLSLLLGTGIVIVLYLSVNLAYSLVLTPGEMVTMKEGEANKNVAIGFCRHLLGPVGVAVVAGAVMCSVFGALNGNLLVGPRLLYAMSLDGLAPRSLQEVHSRYRTPAVAILLQAGWTCGLVLGVALLTQAGVLNAKKDHFDILTDLVIFGAAIFETMAVATVFVFRRKLPDAVRPYRCIGYPVLPALYVVAMALVLVGIFFRKTEEALIGLGVIATGAGVYYFYGQSSARLRSCQNPTEGTESSSSAAPEETRP